MPKITPFSALSRKNQMNIALACGSGVLFFLAFPAFNLYLLGWIAFVPLLFALEKSSLKQSYLLGLITGMVIVAFGFYWMGDWASIVMEIPFPLNKLIIAGHAFCIGQVLGFVCLIYQWLRNYKKVDDLILFPVVTVTVFSIFPMLFYFHPADGQSYFLISIQAVEIFGVYGLDFILALVNILIYSLIRVEGKKLDKKWFGIASLLIIGWFGYGVVKLSQWDERIENWETKNIGLVQPNRVASLNKPVPEKGYSGLRPLEMEMSRKLADEGAEMIVWPEGHFFGYIFYPNVREAFRVQIKNLSTPIVFLDSTFRKINKKKHYYNSSIYIDSQGDFAGQYDKMRLVPFGEYTPLSDQLTFIKDILGDFLSGLSAGIANRTFDIAGMRIVPKICYESIFPQDVANAIGSDALGKVLLVQTQNGWYGETSEPEQHMTITTLRAVENRIPMIHVMNNGSSAIVLPNGRYAFQSTPFVRGNWVGKMPFSADSGGSFFSRHPRMFINLIQIVFVILILFRLQSQFGKKLTIKKPYVK